MVVSAYSGTHSGKDTQMEHDAGGFRSIDEYIAKFPAEVQVLLQTLRATIHAAAPEAREQLSYGMPAFALHGILVYFAAAKRHIGFYPTSSGIAAFQAELAGYASSKGAVQFPLDQPLPLDLISRMVQFRVAEDRAKAAAKGRKKDE